jgi:hypothetical protein
MLLVQFTGKMGFQNSEGKSYQSPFSNDPIEVESWLKDTAMWKLGAECGAIIVLVDNNEPSKAYVASDVKADKKPRASKTAVAAKYDELTKE